MYGPVKQNLISLLVYLIAIQFFTKKTKEKILRCRPNIIVNAIQLPILSYIIIEETINVKI